jgi:mandelate racemase
MVDFNQALSVAEALKRGRMIDAEGGVDWIEEPIRADDFAGAAKLARELATPVQLGENFMGPEQMAQAIAAQACDFVMPDAQRIGGVTGWMRAAALAQGAGMEMSSHLFPEVSCHLLAALPLARVCRLGRCDPGGAGPAEGRARGHPGRARDRNEMERAGGEEVPRLMA